VHYSGTRRRRHYSRHHALTCCSRPAVTG